MNDVAEHFKEVRYDSISGLLYWAYSRRGARMGEIAGSLTNEGYRQVQIKRKVYSAHRLCWAIFYGSWPLGELDHINGDRADNRIENLRDVDRSINSQNKRVAQVNNKSCGLLGVTWNKQHKKWQSKIMAKKKMHHVGYFLDPDDAHRAYLEMKRVLHVGCTI